MRWLTVICLAAIVTLAAGTAAADVIPLEGDVPNAAVGRVTTAGLSFIGEVASQLLGQIDIADMLYGLNPLFNLSTCELIFKGAGNITNVSIGQVDVALSSTAINGLTPVTNGLYVEIQISPAAGQKLLTIDINGAWGSGCTTPFDATGTINATPLELSASATVSYPPGKKGFNVTVHQVLLNTANITIEFTGLPDASLGPLLQQAIIELLPGLLEEMGPQFINDAIAPLLANISLDGTTAFGNYTLAYAFDPKLTTNSHGIDLNVGGHLYLEGTTVDSCIDPGSPIGSPYTNGTPPTFGSLTPSGGAYDVGIAISDNILNQLLYSMVVKGSLCMMFPFSIGADGSGFPGVDAAAPVPPEATAAANLIDLYPVDLPHFEIGQSASQLDLVTQPYRLDWYIQKEGRWVDMLTAEINLDLSLTMSITADNALKISLANSEVQFEMHGSEYNILPPNLIQTLLNGLINNVLLPKLSDALPTIPLPTLLGYKLVLEDIGDMGAQNNYFGLYCNFEAASAAESPRLAPAHFGAIQRQAPRTAVRFKRSAIQPSGVVRH